jgi:hypothetical protein
MEPEVSAFLARIAKSISLVLLWMLINTYFGNWRDLFFLDGPVTAWHIVFYVWFVVSGIGLYWYIIKIWKQAPVYDPKENIWYYKTRGNQQSSADEAK